MQLVDEITERHAARSARQTTSAVKTELPPPTPHVDPSQPAPFAPRLPPVMPKVSGPAPMATTPASNAMQMFQAAAQAAMTPASVKRPKRRRKLLMAFGIVVAMVATVAIAFRNSGFVERFTGKGYDTNPLPTHSVPMPPIGGVEYTFSSQSVAVTDGLPTNYWTNERDLVNFTTKSASLTFGDAKASIIGGSIGTPQSIAPPEQIFIDEGSTYSAGAIPNDPWIRKPHEAGSSTPQLLSRNEVHMYQDVFDPALRALQPSNVIDEVRHEVAVTTYTYTFEFGKFYESAPRLFDLMRGVDGNAADDAKVTVTISLDAQWMVRYLDVDVDYVSVLEHRAEKDLGVHYPYRYTIDVISTATAPAVGLPTKVVDETTTTTTAVVAP